MKKMLICCGALCLTLLLFCGSAFAAVTVTGSDGTVDVTVNEAGTEITVNKKSGVDAENLYLLMVQEGTELPTSQNLYYLNVEKQGADSFTPMKAYPKDGFLTDGKTYTVYLSDWSATGNGARKAVATLTVGGDDPVHHDDPDVLYGDVNGDGRVARNDRIILTAYLADKESPDYGPGKKYNVVEANADVNSDGRVARNDRIILTRHLANEPGYEKLPYSAN